jgi:hypothetical protein
MSGTKEPETTGDKLTMPMKQTRRHNKPKKAHDYVVAPEGTDQILPFHAFATFIFPIINICFASTVIDYVCTDDDRSVIAKIRNEPNDKRNLVSIEDAYLTRPQLLTLLTHGEFLGDEVSIHSFMTRSYL